MRRSHSIAPFLFAMSLTIGALALAGAYGLL